MKPISDQHCWIELRMDHPTFGQLTIETFQRHIDDCERIVLAGKIHYRGNDFPLLGTHKLEYPPGHSWKAFYAYLIPWDWLHEMDLRLTTVLEEARNYIDNYASSHDEASAHSVVMDHLRNTIRCARS